MKKLLVAFFAFSSLSLSAQRKIEKEVDYHNEAVEVELELASSIVFKTWNKSKIRIEAIIDSEVEGLEDQFELLVSNTGSNIEIRSNEIDLFRKDGDDSITIEESSKSDFSYIIYVPEGAAMKISSISGDIASEFLKGDISIALVSGDIDIRKFEGDLELKTVSGKISLPAKNTSFEAKTLMGEIYANADSRLKKKDRFIGQEMSLNVEESPNRLRLDTVTGDIDLQ